MKNFTQIYQQIKKKLESQIDKPKILFYEIEHTYITATIKQLISENCVQPVILKYAKEVVEAQIATKVEVITCESLFNEKTLNFFRKAVSKSKRKYSEDDIEKLAKAKRFLAAMLHKTGEVDAYIAGIIHTTAEVLSPALRIMREKTGAEFIFSTRFLYNDTNIFAISDTTLIVDPTADQLGFMAKNLYNYFKQLDFFDHYIYAFLSYSTLGSGSGPEVDKVREGVKQATSLLENVANVTLLGPIQFDAAYDLRVRKVKMGENVTKDPANIYICPNLQVANISYKIIQNLAGWNNVSLPLVGLDGNVTDLSRGVNQASIKVAVMFLAYKVVMERT